jgi:peptide/nickel transport system ATP-binding protein
MSEMALMELKHIHHIFKKNNGNGWLENRYIHVLKDIDLSIDEGEIVALVGESGCGKTTLGKIITGLIKPSKGDIYYLGRRVSYGIGQQPVDMQTIQFVQQDSYAALNPVRTIQQSLYAPLRTKNPTWTKQQIENRINELMNLISLEPANQFLTKYPHQLSGGQRQRILMARAVSLNPRLIVADEPVSMIDVSLRLSILNLMTKLNETLNVSFVYITHDLSTARYIAKNGRICVMYLGEIVEMGSVSQILNDPQHPYTRALIQAVPTMELGSDNDLELPLKSMELASLVNRSVGCSFQPRCLYATERCEREIANVDYRGVQVKCCNLEAIRDALRNR